MGGANQRLHEGLQLEKAGACRKLFESIPVLIAITAEKVHMQKASGIYFFPRNRNLYSEPPMSHPPECLAYLC